MTSEQFAVTLAKFLAGMQLPAAMSRMSQLARRMNDPGANHLGQQAMSVATAAASDNDRLLELLEAAGDYFTTVAADLSPAYGAYFTLTFSGAAGQELTYPVSGSWITTTTVVMVQTNTGPASPYYGAFAMGCDAPTSGAFTIRIRNVGGAPANTYSFKWMATDAPP